MKFAVTRINFLFILAIATLLLRQAFWQKHVDGFQDALCSFTFKLFSFEISIYIIVLIAIIIPTIVLYILFYDIYKDIMSFKLFIDTVFLHHIFFCCTTGCVLYLIDIIQDFYNKSNASPTEWHKYIFHFILTPALFVDSVYSIEIQKIRKKKEGGIQLIRGKIYYFSQIFIATYLIYCLCVVLYLEGELEEIIKAVFQLREPEFTGEFSSYIQSFSNSAVECVFLTLFFGLVDQNVIIEKIISRCKVFNYWDCY